MQWETIWRSKLGIHGRTPKVQTSDCECDICGEHKMVLLFVSSDGEYSDIMICKECNDKLWEASDAWEKHNAQSN